MNSGRSQPKDKNRYFIFLNYTKPKTNNITFMLVEPNNEKAITMQAKKVLVKVHAFLSLHIVKNGK